MSLKTVSASLFKQQHIMCLPFLMTHGQTFFCGRITNNIAKINMEKKLKPRLDRNIATK